jgi:hypothetical protein
MRARRFVGILERRLLRAAMSAVLFVVERRLSRRSVKPPSPGGADGP